MKAAREQWLGLAAVSVAFGLMGCAGEKTGQSSEQFDAKPLARSAGSPVGAAAARVEESKMIPIPPEVKLIDGWPTGQDSPEGVACDFARAFIACDSKEFARLCWTQANEGKYNDFLTEMKGELDRAKAMGPERARGPKSISKVYRVRSLSRNGPGSAGYALYQLLEVKFVDVVSPLWGGGSYTNRTLVVKQESDGKWYVIPSPEAFELLSTGLNDESDSTVVWTPEGASGRK